MRVKYTLDQIKEETFRVDNILKELDKFCKIKNLKYEVYHDASLGEYILKVGGEKTLSQLTYIDLLEIIRYFLTKESWKFK